eukprot:CAMPEP_0197517112 /NCGR_PEP_ID=MMETSP1318-20131121/2083_1 /TAXON_ID=552666 /ORGANISM="Partenskyella glossopodia, Strain RCC365" /LENGTH=1597 /DNA_ID=CAMNT_0043066413 /DNA_START=40 /DNA_END=4833 /DNA_ORIENTATION=+
MNYDSYEWHYVGLDDVQKGPVTFEFLKGIFSQLDDSCLLWHAEMDGWTELGQLPDVKRKLKPKPKPKKKKPPLRRPPAKGRAGPPSGGGPAALKGALAKSEHEGETRSQHSNSISLTNEFKRIAAEVPNEGWRRLHAADGTVYYHNTISDETTYDVPEVFQTEDDKVRDGEWLWVPDKEEGFIKAKVINRLNDGGMQIETEAGESRSIKKKKAKRCEKLDWHSLRRPEQDLVLLDVMNEPLIMWNLHERFKNNEIYTNVGTILIAVNPFKRLPLYTPSIIDKYAKRGNRILPPHVFHTASEAYRNLLETKTEKTAQSVVISGESGAGKTVCTKFCLKYLAEVADSEGGVEEKILLANPILEAFGNAKTTRNNNSSRFGKYVEIFFDKRMRICGSKITNYLLEKSRVVLQGPGERNYHIFYQMLKGADNGFLQKLGLSSNTEDYHYTNQTSPDVDGMDDTEEWGILLKSFETLEFDKKEQNDVLTLTAGVLHMGNIEFKSTGDRKCGIKNKRTLAPAAQLFQVDSKRLEKVVTSRIVKIRGQEPIEVGLSVEEATAARDALAKFIFEHMFDWLVERINKSIGTGKYVRGKTVGILDIFGFEIFKTNSFEQLCINYTNEKLQQFFNQHTFKLEEALYTAEKIKYTKVAYIDNQPVLELIEKKPKGVLPMIDEELRLPKGSDATYVEKLLKTHNSNKNNFGAVLKRPNNFIVKHYAGEVEYESYGFLEKNKDRLYEDAYALLSKSSFRFLSKMFPSSDEAGSKTTLGAKFRKQLNDLMRTLNATYPHYIRCIKPNAEKAAMKFTVNMCLEQLRYSGVFEAVKIRKQGYPFRYTHENFLKRFKCIDQKRNWGNGKKGCFALLKEMKVNEAQVGERRVLYRASNHRKMELIRNVAVEKRAIVIERYCRRYIARKEVKAMKAIRPRLLKVLQSRDLDTLQAALDNTGHIHYPMREIQQIKRKIFCIKEEKRLEKVLVGLLDKDPERNFTALSRAVAAADEIGMPGEIADRCREMLHKVKEKKRVEREMRMGMEELDEQKLRNALAEAQQAGADREKIQQAQARLDKIVREKRAIEEIGSYQRHHLEEAPMQNIIDRAEQINYVTDDIAHLKHLLYDLSPEKFAQEQLKAAVRSKDQDRCIRITIRIKDMFFKQQGEMFTFRGFPKFRTPVEWANLKFTLFSSTRDELQRNMFFWTKTPIHASMIELPAKMGKDSVRMFRNLLGFMGDRQYSFPELLVGELVKEGLEKPPLRDEIFAHIIKQLTQNPNPTSAHKGWSALAVCLESFPPNPEFENYFEVWIRKNVKDAKKRNRYLTLLHQAIFCGARSVPPSEGEIQSILNGQTLRRKARFQDEEKAAPDYEGLKVEVADEEIVWNEVEDVSAYDNQAGVSASTSDYKRRPKPRKPAPKPKFSAPKPSAPKPSAPKPSAPKPAFSAPKPSGSKPKKPALPAFKGPKPGLPKLPKGPRPGGPKLPKGPRPPGGAGPVKSKPKFKPKLARKPSHGPVIPRMSHGNSIAARRKMLKAMPMGPGSKRKPKLPAYKKPTKPALPAPKPSAPKPPPPAAPKPKPPPVSLWRATVDPASGDTYYWNVETQEVTWDKPADFVG